MTAPPPDPAVRLAALEHAVEALRQEVAALCAAQSTAVLPHSVPRSVPEPTAPLLPPAVTYAATYAAYSGAAPAPARRLPTDRLRTAARNWVTGLGVPELPADRAGLETLVGRYAAVAVGALVLLMGVGAFLTWAVANFTLAPATRVALGAAGAPRRSPPLASGCAVARGRNASARCCSPSRWPWCTWTRGRRGPTCSS